MTFDADIEELARENEDYRKVLYTGKSQLVLMSLRPGEEIGEETHTTIDQIFVFVEGVARATLDGMNRLVPERHVLVVPAGTRHNVANVGDLPLKLFTIYAPPAHASGTLHPTKADAEREEVATG